MRRLITINSLCVFLCLFSTFQLTNPLHAQDEIFETDDLGAEGDIFSDFNEDIESSQILEDERFYRYGRFFSVNMGIGVTSFTGNRGSAYSDNPPSYTLYYTYFFNFQTAFVLGIQYSKHTMFIDTYVNSYDESILGVVETSMLRPFMGLRLYLDTTNLGTAITYSNPYIIGRFEYWYQKNKFSEQPTLKDQAGGGVGLAFGGGLEFPIELRKSYVGVEFLFHQVNFFDQYTQDYRQITDQDRIAQNKADYNISDYESKYGFNDLTGYAYSVMVTYNITW